MYEAEYDPPLTSDPVLREGDIRRVNPDGLAYTYARPHTCDSVGDYCRKKAICPHHTCTRKTCGFKCVDESCDDCDKVPGLPSGGANQLLVHAEMYGIGVKYGVHGLDELAKEKFDKACHHYWNTLEFEEVAVYVCEHHLDGLREVLVATIAAHTKLIEKEKIEKLVRKNGRLAVDVLKKKAEDGW